MIPNCTHNKNKTMARKKQTARKSLNRRAKANGRASTVHGRKPRRYRPGTVAKREVRHFEKTTHLLIPKSAFSGEARYVNADLTFHPNKPKRMTTGSIAAMQLRWEDKLTELLMRTDDCAKHAGRKQIMKDDMKLVQKIKMKNGLLY
jgi:histone H3